MQTTVELTAIVSDEQGGRRLDQVASELFGDFSRSQLQEWIKSGALTLDGRQVKPREKVYAGSLLEIVAELESLEWQAEAIDLDIVYIDDTLLILNKPVGMVVHPAAGNYTGTLLNALLHHFPELTTLPRAGIVHRLDKDTSGLMVVARTTSAYMDLTRQLQERTVKRQYEAIVQGVMTGGGTVDKPIGRHPQSRLKMAVLSHGGKEAITHYRVLERFRSHTHVQLNLETGRTHQIRVHMAHIRHPIVGDPVYGGRPILPPNARNDLIEALRGLQRQALHARQLGLVHPATGKQVQWEIDLPEDMQNLLWMLQEDCQLTHD